MKAPQAAIKPQKVKVHGDVRLDEYAWLQKAKDSAVRAYLDAENAHADTEMRPSARLRNTIYRQIRSRITEDDTSVPIKDGPYLYYSRTRKGRQYAIHCRKPVGGGIEEVILDENILARGSKFFALGATDVNPDHDKLAYTCDKTGNEHFTLFFKDLKTGRHLRERIQSVAAVVWAEDGEHVFYTKEEHPFPPRKVYRHRLGDDPAHDVVIFEEKDPRWYVHVSKSRSKKYIFISVANFDATEQWYLPSDDITAAPRLLAKRRKRIKYSVEHWGERFFIVTNEGAINYKIMHVSEHDPRKANWQAWLPYNPSRAITEFLAFRDFFVFTAREEGSEWAYVCFPARKKPGKIVRIPLPEAEHTIDISEDMEFDSTVVRLSYGSFLTPRTVYDYDVRKKTLTVRKRQRVPRWSPKAYTSETQWVKSGNVKVPVSIVRPKRIGKKGVPLLLEAYGSYGFSSDPYFSVARLALLERGWAIAIAHPRGGGEMGWSWHKAAYRMTKHRTYRDLIAIADHLVKKHYTTRDTLAVSGGSAGGMTWGAVLNLRPDLCKAAVIHVPNADVVTSMLDTSLGGTLLHYDELGDPRKRREYHYLKRWSPYENIKKADYPAMLVRTSFHDIRTPYWESAKWVARLRAKATFRGPLFLKTEMNAGHAGKSGRYEWIRETAFDYAFLITMLETKARGK
jgi:oligopeptidase B